MNIGALIKSLLKAIIPAGLLWIMVVGILFFEIEIADVDSWNENVAEAVFLIIYIILYAIIATYFYNSSAKKSTCPRCKTPFVFYEKCVGSETLSEDYISKDVKDSDGRYRRKSYKVGKERNYYESKCKECGHTTKRDAVINFQREV